MNFVQTGRAQKDLARRNFVHEGMAVLVSAPQRPRN